MRAKAFGPGPKTRVFIRVQQHTGGKVTGTKSFSVYGSDHDSVSNVIEAALASTFGDGELDFEPEPEPVPIRHVKSIKKKKVVARA